MPHSPLQPHFTPVLVSHVIRRYIFAVFREAEADSALNIVVCSGVTTAPSTRSDSD